MFDSLLGGKFFKKCKYCVRCIDKRLVLITKKRQATVKFLKKDVADLLAKGHDDHAFRRIEALIVEINHISCYDMIGKYCQCILNQLPCLQKQRECPEEVAEAVSTLIFAAARFSDLPELYDLRHVFTERYGSHMESSVNTEFVEKMQKKSFPTDIKLQLMQDIAKEFSVRWDFKAFQRTLSNPPPPLLDQPTRLGSNDERLSHAEMNAAFNQLKAGGFSVAGEVNGQNIEALNAAGSANSRKKAMFNADVAVNGRKEAVINAGGFSVAGEVNGQNIEALNAAGSANRRKKAMFNADVAVNGRKEAVINSGAAVSGRDKAICNAGGSTNGRKEVVLNADITFNGRDRAVLNEGGLVNGRKEIILNADLTDNGREETVNSVFAVNRKNEVVLSSGCDQEIPSNERWEPPPRRLVQKQQGQPEPRDIHVIPNIHNGWSHDPIEKTRKLSVAAEERENVEPGYHNSEGRPYIKPKASQKDWSKPKVIQNGFHKDDCLSEGTACNRSLVAQEGPGLIGLEKQSVAPVISRDVKAVNMVPPYTKLKGVTDGSNAAVDCLPIYNELSRAEKMLDPTVQERPPLPVNSKDARPINMIPPYTKPKLRNPSTPADDTELANEPISNSCTADYERAKPVSVRRRIPKPPLVIETDNAVNDAKSMSKKPTGQSKHGTVNGDLYAEEIVDRHRRKAAEGEMNDAIKHDRHVHGTSSSQRRHGSRRSTATYDGDHDEEEEAMDRLLVHYSKKGRNRESSTRRTRMRALSAELVVDAGKVGEYPDDHLHHGNGRRHPSTKEESIRCRPERVASLPPEPTCPVAEVGVNKGPVRTISMQPDLLSPNLGRLHPRLPDYDDLAARFIALKNA